MVRILIERHSLTMANSKKRCRYCKKYFPSDQMININGSNYCSMDHVIAQATKDKNHNAEVAKKARSKEASQKKKEFNENDYRYQYKLTLARCRRLANLLDAHLGCICCDAPRNGVQFCGGHYKTAGGNPELALDLRNIHGQRNKTCNEQKSGNIEGDKHSHGFTEGLRRRYGQELVDWLDGPHEMKQNTPQSLIAYRKEVNAEIRRLESGLPPSKDWRALP